MLLKVKKYVSIFFSMLLIGSSFTSGSLENAYIRYPRSPVPEEGKIVPFPVKGTVAFITAEQKDYLGSGLTA